MLPNSCLLDSATHCYRTQLLLEGLTATGGPRTALRAALPTAPPTQSRRTCSPRVTTPRTSSRKHKSLARRGLGCPRVLSGPRGLRFCPRGLRFCPRGLRFCPRGLRFCPRGLRFCGKSSRARGALGGGDRGSSRLISFHLRLLSAHLGSSRLISRFSATTGRSMESSRAGEPATCSPLEV